LDVVPYSFRSDSSMDASSEQTKALEDLERRLKAVEAKVEEQANPAKKEAASSSSKAQQVQEAETSKQTESAPTSDKRAAQSTKKKGGGCIIS